MVHVFPKNFTWGAATAAYQVEGAVHEGGRVASIWDTFTKVPGAVCDGSSGERACGQYHLYPRDIALMRELGINAYRLSIAWPRITSGPGTDPNPAGLDHYRRVLDALRDAGIKPVVTLYHWDLPQYLEDIGGWTNRDVAFRYADYASTVASALGDRVDTWTTLNEPWCSAYLGYGNGEHAPGIRDYGKAMAAVHHLNLAHGLGAQAIRAELGDAARVSVTLNLAMNIAETDSDEDRAAKRRADLLANEAFLGPMLEGRYDPELMEVTARYSDWSFVRQGDCETIHQPLQSLGINYYSSAHVRHAHGTTGTDGSSRNPMPAQEIVEVVPPAGELTAMGWNQEPSAMTHELVETSRRFPDLDLVVTENGSAWEDEVTFDDSAHGRKVVHDPRRVAYLNAHIAAMGDAMDAGAKVAGYFAWSLIDNFEWSFGYTKRFGLIRVDYDTQERIWKDSGRRYAQIVRANAI